MQQKPRQQSDVRKRNIIRKLTARFAAATEDGRPLKCWPSEDEIERGIARGGQNGKVIFATESAAKQFVGNLMDSVEGVGRVRVYPCPRAGHWHTTTQFQRNLT